MLPIKIRDAEHTHENKERLHFKIVFGIDASRGCIDQMSYQGTGHPGACHLDGSGR